MTQPLRVDVVTIFPDYLAPLGLSLVGKARQAGLVEVRVHDLREHTHDTHRTVDDTPYGGGPGMVMKPEPWWEALEAITADPPDHAAKPRVIVTSPAGRPLTQALAQELSQEQWLVFACGRYEGIDSRVVDHWATDEISIGDYVLAGGEAAALVICEAVIRLLPGVLGNADSAGDDSFSAGLLEAPMFTRPPTVHGREVPPVLLSGDHGAIARWRREQSLRRTAGTRPDLLASVALTEAERHLVASLQDPASDPGLADEPPGVAQ